MSQNVQDVVIFGSGPAGCAAALYCSRANMAPVVFEGLQPGGQLTITTDVDNYPGFPDGIMGPELMEHMKKQCARFGTRFSYESAESVDCSTWPFHYKAGGEEGYTRAIIVATGASAKYLGLENELRLQGYGVSACATCDGFFYRDQVVCVVGGGDSAAEEASFLTKFASTVYLIVRRDELRASKIMQKRVLENERVDILWNTQMIDVHGEDAVTGIRILNNKTSEERDIDLQGVFLAIGHKPNSDPFLDFVDTDETGYIVTAADSTTTRTPGLFACGDVQDHVYRQAITAAGSGCMAALETERWLEAHSFEDLPRRPGF